MNESAQSTARPSFVIAAGNVFFRRRNWLFPVVFLLVAAATEPWMFLKRPEADRWMDLAGVLVILTGQTIRVLVIGLAYIRRGGKNKQIYADDLVTSGIFAHSRNPLYLGNILVFVGLLVVLNSPAGWIVGLPFFLFAYWAITLAEENFLRGKFGPKYEDYCRTVNRFFPSLSGLGDTLRSMQFEWQRVIRKEYGSAFAWVLTLLALLVWERIAWWGIDGAAPAMRAAGVALALATFGYALARYLKKSRRLGTA